MERWRDREVRCIINEQKWKSRPPFYYKLARKVREGRRDIINNDTYFKV